MREGGGVGEGKRGRQEERVWWKRRRGGRMCRETAETEKGRGGGEARAKAEARFTSPRIPASFYRPRDD